MPDSLLHSYFLQVLGSAIIHSIWQSLFLWMIYKAITLSATQIKPEAKHNLAVIMVFLSFAWFLYAFLTRLLIQPIAVSRPIQVIFANKPTQSFLSIPANVSASLSIAYLILLSLLMARLFFSLRNTLNIRTSQMKPVASDISMFTMKAATLLKIRRKVTVWICQTVSNPATIGFLKPIILLPAVCITHLSPLQLEAIILHELSHIRRNDFLINIILLVVETILFFNPFVYLFMKQIQREREHCCDDLVLKYNYEPVHYAKALLAISAYQPATQKLVLNAVSGKYQLLHRIKRITSGDLQKPPQFSIRILALGIVLLVFLGILSFIPKSDPNKSEMISKNIRIKEKTIPLIQKEESKKAQKQSTKNSEVILEKSITKNQPTDDDNQSLSGLLDKVIHLPAESNLTVAGKALEEAQTAINNVDWKNINLKVQSELERATQELKEKQTESRSFQAAIEKINIEKYQHMYLNQAKNIQEIVKGFSIPDIKFQVSADSVFFNGKKVNEAFYFNSPHSRIIPGNKIPKTGFGERSEEPVIRIISKKFLRTADI